MQNKPSYSYRFNLQVQNDEDKIGLCENKEPPICSLVTGSAGVGKSFQAKELVRNSPKKHILAATTGIAAINLGEEAKTIHSTLKFFNADSCRRGYVQGYLQWNLTRLLNSGIETLHIDEGSMLSSPILDDIVEAMAEVNNACFDNKKLSLEVIADFLQLPAVPDKTSINPRARKGEFLFKANSWKFFNDNITRLRKIWRQDNPTFVSALNALRAGEASEAVKLLHLCGVRFENKTDENFSGTTLIAKNDAVDAYNLSRLNKLPGKLLRSLAIRKGKQLKEWDDNIPFEFRTKENAYVMILKNDVKDWEYVNGDCGDIVDYDAKTDEFLVKLVRNSKVVRIGKVTRLNTIDKEPTEKDITGSFKPRVDFKEGKWVIGEISYHPLRAAWASTIHKCLSGNTYVQAKDKGYIQLSELKVGDFIWDGIRFVEVIEYEQTHQYPITIMLENGFNIICSQEHKFPVNYNNNGLYDLKEAKSLSISDSFMIWDSARKSSRKEFIKDIQINTKELHPMIDIEVKSDSHLFVANGILTHNSQGLSLDRVQISTSHSFFGYASMAYVSISRCRTPEGLIIVGTPKELESKIKTSKEVLEWI